MDRFYLHNPTFYFTAWQPVKRDVNIPFDLEGTPLQIKTNSAPGSEQMIYVEALDAQNHLIQNISKVDHLIQNDCYKIILQQKPFENVKFAYSDNSSK